MKLLLLLPLLSFVRSAPLGEEVAPLDGLRDQETRVKKAKEFSMFENEQNAPHETEKRSDPSLVDDDSIDLAGEVKANEPTDLKYNNSKENEDIESVDTDSERTEQEEPISPGYNNDNKETNPISEEIPNEGDSPETEESAKSDDMHFPDIKGTEDYLSNYKQMLGALSKPYPNEKWGQLYDDQSYNVYPLRSRYQRYRRSQNRRFNSVPILRRAVKRTRRIKRDLFYPGSGLVEDYDPYDEGYVVDPYEDYEPRENEDLISLLDLLDNARQYDESNYVNDLGYVYGWPEEDEENTVYEEKPKYYVPKRQAGLSFVPGIKRSRSFYPYFEEPQSHFSAFVPQKRKFHDYEDEYERVMRLAAALREQNEYPEEYGYQLYRRK